MDAIELARQMALASTGGASNERDDGIKIRIVEIIRGADSIKKNRFTDPQIRVITYRRRGNPIFNSAATMGA